MTKRYDTPNSARSQNTRTLRHATVQRTLYPPLANAGYNPRCRLIPWINLKDHWLHNVGFTIGTPYTITVGEGLLILQESRAFRHIGTV